MTVHNVYINFFLGLFLLWIRFNIVSFFKIDYWTGFAWSDTYTGIVFPSYDGHKPNTTILVDSSDTEISTILIGDKSTEKQGAFNISLTDEFSNLPGRFQIKASRNASIIMETEDQNHFYQTKLKNTEDLGNEYMLISNSKANCFISPILENNADIDIVVPSDLQNKIKINGSQSINSSYKLLKEAFIQIESEAGLHHMMINSNNDLIVFCRDSSVFQLLPQRFCGKYFEISCESVNVNGALCNVSIHTVKMKSQLISINGFNYTVFDIWTVSLKSDMQITVHAEFDICVLFTEQFENGPVGKVVRTTMLSSLSKQPKFDVTSPVLTLAYFNIQRLPQTKSTDGISVKGKLESLFTGFRKWTTVIRKKSVPLSSFTLNTTLLFDALKSTTSSQVSSYPNICSCTCTKFNGTFNASFRPRTSSTEELTSRLKVNLFQLSSVTRRKSCAVDNRTSAQQIGYVGAVAIIFTLGSIILLDVIDLYQKCCHKLKKSTFTHTRLKKKRWALNRDIKFT